MVTIAQLSKDTGFSKYTVSCALRGVGDVAAKTRRLILERARKLGYQPNSAAAMMARQRHRRRSERLQVPVALLGPDSQEFQRTFVSACAALGLEGRTPPMPRAGRMGAELDRLWHTGVRGIYMIPERDTAPALEAADFSRFAVVKWTRAYPALRFHLVRHSAFDYMLETVNRVFAAGYRRVAALIVESISQHDDLARIGALTAFRERRLPPRAELRLFFSAEPSQRGVKRALRFRPDAVIGFPFSWFYELRNAGVAMPRDIGFATVMEQGQLLNTPRISGCDAADDEATRRAVARLFRLLERGERGFASNPTEEVIEPVWVEGETLGQK